MKKGHVTPNAGSTAPVDVEYELRVFGPDDARGRVRIGDDPMPGARFMGDPSSALGDPNCILETAKGIKIQIFFTNSDGTFVCCLADEAKAALEAEA